MAFVGGNRVVELVGVVPSKRRNRCLRHEPRHRPRRGKERKLTRKLAETWRERLRVERVEPNGIGNSSLLYAEARGPRSRSGPQVSSQQGQSPRLFSRGSMEAGLANDVRRSLDLILSDCVSGWFPGGCRPTMSKVTESLPPSDVGRCCLAPTPRSVVYTIHCLVRRLRDL